jgi:hypothetical protein
MAWGLGLRAKAAPLQAVPGDPGVDGADGDRGVSVPSQLPGAFGRCPDGGHNRVAEAPGL